MSQILQFQQRKGRVPMVKNKMLPIRRFVKCADNQQPSSIPVSIQVQCGIQSPSHCHVTKGQKCQLSRSHLLDKSNGKYDNTLSHIQVCSLMMITSTNVYQIYSLSKRSLIIQKNSKNFLILTNMIALYCGSTAYLCLTSPASSNQ